MANSYWFLFRLTTNIMILLYQWLRTASVIYKKVYDFSIFLNKFFLNVDSKTGRVPKFGKVKIAIIDFRIRTYTRGFSTVILILMCHLFSLNLSLHISFKKNNNNKTKLSTSYFRVLILSLSLWDGECPFIFYLLLSASFSHFFLFYFFYHHFKFSLTLFLSSQLLKSHFSLIEPFLSFHFVDRRKL